MRRTETTPVDEARGELRAARADVERIRREQIALCVISTVDPRMSELRAQERSANLRVDRAIKALRVVIVDAKLIEARRAPRVGA